MFLQFRTDLGCGMEYVLRPPPPPSVTRAPSAPAQSSNAAGIIAGVLVSLLFATLVAVLLYRRRHSEQANRKAIEAQLLQALQSINGRLSFNVKPLWLWIGCASQLHSGLDASACTTH